MIRSRKCGVLVLVFALGFVAFTADASACSVMRNCDNATVVLNRLRGQIYGPERTVPGATVSLYQEDRYCQWDRDVDSEKGAPRAKLARQVKTNDYGEFKFGQIPAGKYLMVIGKDGRQIDHTDISVLSGPDDAWTSVEIRFPTLPVSISASCGGMPSWRFGIAQGKE